jgi:hypothetical protein
MKQSPEKRARSRSAVNASRPRQKVESEHVEVMPDTPSSGHTARPRRAGANLAVLIGSSLQVIRARSYSGAMPIPGLDGAGLLPPGVHDCTLDEVRQVFGVFQSTDRRPKLYDKLQSLVQEAWATGLVSEIVIDGSFVTAKTDPNDIDLILVLNPGHDFTAELRPFEYNVLSRRQARKIYGFDLLVAMPASAIYVEYLAFFAQVRGDTNRRKGLLRLRHDQK